MSEKGVKIEIGEQQQMIMAKSTKIVQIEARFQNVCCGMKQKRLFAEFGWNGAVLDAEKGMEFWKSGTTR